MKYKDIRLRALEPEDLELLYNWENNLSYWVISNTVSPFSKYTLKRYVENSHKSIYETGQLRLMVDHIHDKVSIGTIDIFEFDAFHKRAGLGILIANEEYRRKGYATMALTCLVDYCFKTLQLHQLYCNILTNNCESIDLFKKTGFVETGVKKEWIKTSDGYLDEHMFQLINPK
ncbi:MAG: GNAT family N-acetyltransferase [Bacteroidetes bacterium GWE2_41_25]|nr:MAG: GNAT family N-acetyltransferase [Bacteroidetes bacterium GWA2_40_15]OFX89728.1 MAG: GNAT family N-acetyltransferase [Bacteroidetes bacterium GWC2_40_22]OFY00644.1 MAG: GNAT family N-acetyltransferase [Bacteroidetes bacterium GWE2_41_25]OFY57116.1 MAG: GNAT family N-acetyltransferase [Bacteroidetes bacterium GWF2_41_9]HAM09454.1 GNAT family N-acetyltransferase [Bacteroidales bacterium]